MKSLTLLALSMLMFSCSSLDRNISSEEQLTQQERQEQLGEFGSGYRR